MIFQIDNQLFHDIQNQVNFMLFIFYYTYLITFLQYIFSFLMNMYITFFI